MSDTPKTDAAQARARQLREDASEILTAWEFARELERTQRHVQPREEIIEECAELCASVAKENYKRFPGYAAGAAKCSEDIRALKNTPQSEVEG